VAIGEYHGDYALEFEIAISAWWIGRREESIELLKNLSARPELSLLYRNAVENNLKNLGIY